MVTNNGCDNELVCGLCGADAVIDVMDVVSNVTIPVFSTAQNPKPAYAVDRMPEGHGSTPKDLVAVMSLAGIIP